MKLFNHSYTDEQLLNLVNNTIIENTKYGIDKFTGGSVSTTSTYNNKFINYRVSLFFGYKHKKPIARTFDIKKEQIAIWNHAILLKTENLKIDNLGIEQDDLIRKMTKQTDIRTTHSTTGAEELPIVNSKIRSNKVDSIEEEDKYRNTREAIQNYKEIFVKKYNRNSGDYKPFEITLDYVNKIYQEFSIEDIDIPQYQYEFMDYLISHNKEYPDLQVSFYRHLKGKFERGLL